MTPKETTLRALHTYKGDDLERAKFAFYMCDERQMQEVWSGNGETRREVLDGHKARRAEVNEAIDWVTTLPEPR